EVGNVLRQGGGVVVHGLAGQDPAHVRPPLAVNRRGGVAFVIGELMMNAVRGDPEDRSTFKRTRGAGGQEIFDPFRSFVAPMRQQAVVAHPDAEASGNPPQERCERKRLPTEEEQSCDSADMKQHHEAGSGPIYLAVSRCFALQSFQLHACPPTIHYSRYQGDWRLTVILM